jgi:pimeloyl-ACP methyl ester carboxylesterase
MLEDVNGIRFAYSEGGAGEPVVLLVHGFPFNRSMWDSQIGMLRARGRAVAPDLRGFGASEAGPSGPLTMEQHADDLAALLDHLGVRSPVVFVGLSMGGYVAFAFWRRYRERVRALVLADTRAAEDTPEGRAGRLAMAAQAEELNSPQPAIDGMLTRLFAPTLPMGAPIVQRVRGMMAGTDPSTIANGQRGMAARPDSMDLLGTIDVPTLVLVGETDAITPVQEAELMASKIAGARLEVLPVVGHLSNLEHPDAFNQALGTFLDDLGRG